MIQSVNDSIYNFNFKFNKLIFFVVIKNYNHRFYFFYFLFIKLLQIFLNRSNWDSPTSYEQIYKYKKCKQF